MFPQGTPFDLQFTVLGIPVRVIPTFWLVMALLGWNPDRLDLVFLWVMTAFASILFHEFGHALTAAAFGYHPYIVLHHFGGYAAYMPGRDYSPFRSLMITLAGPIPQFMLGVAVYFATPYLYDALEGSLSEEMSLYVQAVLFYLIQINVGWALLNLVPVLPLDGGQATRAVLEMAGLRDSQGAALKISVLFGALTAAGMFQLREQGVGLMFVLLTVSSLQELQARRW